MRLLIYTLLYTTLSLSAHAYYFEPVEDLSSLVPEGGNLLSEGEISGKITNVYYDDIPPHIIEGDVSKGSELQLRFAFFTKDPSFINNGLDYYTLYVEYKVFGHRDTYNFEIWYDRMDWGGIKTYQNNNLTATWSNNFISDGLEDSFYGTGEICSCDAGGVRMDMNHIHSSAVSGSGYFWWEQIKIDFAFGPPVAVTEPSTFGLLFLGIIGWLLRASRRLKDTNPNI